jgi:acetate kinase
MFCRRAAGHIAAIATSLARLDALVFTGGIGENAANVRAQIVSRLGVIGVGGVGDQPVDEDAVLSVAGSSVAMLRVEAREDLVVADAVAELRRGSSGSPTSG